MATARVAELAAREQVTNSGPLLPPGASLELGSDAEMREGEGEREGEEAHTMQCWRACKCYVPGVLRVERGNGGREEWALIEASSAA
jgi:hypothetical protein